MYSEEVFVLLVNVSVIVPVYNAEKWIARCLDSLLNQTMTDYEIICIDDGSTDKSAIILRNYETNYPNIQVIQQQNQGVSAARNKGLEIAKGEYIGFVDIDDWVESDYLELLYNTAKQKSVDIAICGYCIDENHLSQQSPFYERYLKRDEALIEALKQTGYQGFLWNKLFRRSLIYDTNIKFDEKLNILEDLVFVCKCIQQSSTVYYDPAIKYHYNQSVGSTYFISEKSESMYDAANQLIDFLSNENKTICFMAKSWHCYSAGVMYLYYSLQHDSLKTNFYKKEQRRYLKEYLWTHKSNFRMFLRGITIAYFSPIAVWMKNWKNKG